MKNTANNIYTAYWSNNVPAAGGNVNCQFTIRAPQRHLAITHIIIDWFPYFTVSNLRIDFQSTTTQSFGLAISPSVSAKMARTFITTGGTAPTANGDNIIFTFPGSFKFEHFYFTNEILFNLNFSNFDAALAVTHNFSLMVETEEDIIYR